MGVEGRAVGERGNMPLRRDGVTRRTAHCLADVAVFDNVAATWDAFVRNQRPQAHEFQPSLLTQPGPPVRGMTNKLTVLAHKPGKTEVARRSTTVDLTRHHMAFLATCACLGWSAGGWSSLPPE